RARGAGDGHVYCSVPRRPSLLATAPVGAICTELDRFPAGERAVHLGRAQPDARLGYVRLVYPQLDQRAVHTGVRLLVLSAPGAERGGIDAARYPARCAPSLRCE